MRQREFVKCEASLAWPMSWHILAEADFLYDEAVMLRDMLMRHFLSRMFHGDWFNCLDMAVLVTLASNRPYSFTVGSSLAFCSRVVVWNLKI